MTDPISADAGPLEKLKGTAKVIAGKIVGNDDLETEGRLQAAKAETAKEADALDAVAAQREAQAVVDAELRENALAEERLKMEEAAEREQARIEHERAEAERQVDGRFEQRERAVEQQTAQRQAEASREERDALADPAQAEREAMELERRAKAARGTAEVIEQIRESQ